MRVGIDATPLLGPRTGIGNYVAHLIAQLPAALGPADQLVATAFTLRGFGSLDAQLPAGVRRATRPVPARLLRAVWMRSDRVDARRLTGPVDVLHGTNYVLPPARGTAGVVTVHDLAYLRRPDTVAPASLDYLRLVPRAVARGAVVCTPSQAVAEQVRDAYPVPPERVRVTPLGVDEGWASARPMLPERRRALALPATYLLAVGTLEPRKNLQLLIECYRLASGTRIDLPPLVLAGSPGWGPALRTGRVDPARIIRTGHLGNEDLRDVVAGAAGLLFPSLDEGFGLPPLEALACGVPVLAADLAVTREVLADQAAYADPSDPEGFLAAVLALLDKPVGTGPSRRAHASQFTWARCARATAAAYRLAQ